MFHSYMNLKVCAQVDEVCLIFSVVVKTLQDVINILAAETESALCYHCVWMLMGH